MSLTFLCARLPGAILCAGMILLPGCSRSNNLLLGRVEATMGGHTVVVTDCYRLSVVPPQRLADAAGQPAFRFTPCRDADVVIRNAELAVNGQSYGHLNAADSILVDHGVVSIGRVRRQTSARK
jgi:hypothetical protein